MGRMQEPEGPPRTSRLDCPAGTGRLHPRPPRCRPPIQSPREFTPLATSYLLLLASQMACFLAFPVVTPEHWRSRQTSDTYSERFLRFIQRLDADCRHTFASRLAMLGTDLYTVQRAGGWKTQVMVQRYAHLSPDHIKAAVERLAQTTSAGATGTDGEGGLRADAEVIEKIGAPGGIRTPDPRLRRPMLYPTELRAHV
jgi:hypothetical protein